MAQASAADARRSLTCRLPAQLDVYDAALITDEKPHTGRRYRVSPLAERIPSTQFTRTPMHQDVMARRGSPSLTLRSDFETGWRSYQPHSTRVSIGTGAPGLPCRRLSQTQTPPRSIAAATAWLTTCRSSNSDKRAGLGRRTPSE